MEDWQLERYLNSVGKRCFATYFNRFSDWSLSNKDIAETLRDEMGYTWKACNSRTGHARMIIRSGRAIDALDIIIRSNAAPTGQSYGSRDSRFPAPWSPCLI